MSGDDTAESTRAKVLAVIRTAAAPPSVDEIATALDLHHNSVRLHAAALQRSGLIAQGSRASGGRGRPLATYRITSRGAWSGRRDYELLASVLMANLHDSAAEPAGEARRAGRAWGRQLSTHHPDASSRVVTVLTELGFEPEAGADAIELRNCPFRELVDSTGMVCAIHAGMLDGLVDDSRTTVELKPFISANTCAVQMSRA